VPRLNIRLDDNGARTFVNVFKSGIPAMAEDSMRMIAMWVSKELKKRIRDQSFAHAPLSAPYVLKKQRKGLDEKILIATGSYVNSISARRRKVKGEWVWTVGVPETIHGPSGLTYVHLARLLEFGNPRGHLPPRPHWRPVWSIARRKFANILDELTEDLVAKAKKEASNASQR
jgi:hypothetical protein